MVNQLIHRRNAGWTAVDLMFVLAFGLLLLSVVLPALNALNWQPQRTDSAHQLARIGDAIETYHADHERYPGYFARADWKNRRFQGRFNASENLVLSLVGGVTDRAQAKRAYQPHPNMGDRAIDLDRFIDAASPDTYGAYYQPTRGELGAVVGVWPGPNNAMPELIDPATNLPVLYFRPIAGAAKPATANASGEGVFSITPNSNLVLSKKLVKPGGGHATQLYSLLSWRELGANNATNAAANLAALTVDPAKSNLGSGASPNQANDEDDAARDAGGLLLSPGWDGRYLSRLQHRGERRVIDRPEDLEQFDDVWHWTARR